MRISVEVARAPEVPTAAPLILDSTATCGSVVLLDYARFRPTMLPHAYTRRGRSREKAGMKLTISEVKKVPPDPDAAGRLRRRAARLQPRMRPIGRTSYFVRYCNRYGRPRRHTFANGEEMPEKARKRARALLGGVAAGQDPAKEKKDGSAP